ncbi:MAG: GNAT family N-acetyltransferase [Oscillospiraceae bacterium]
MEFEAPEYSDEGVEEFKKSLGDENFVSKLKFYGAFMNDEPAGVLAMREPQHISLFFVKAEYQGKGIGRKLFERMKKDYDVMLFTVNSSPFAVKIYEKFGFTADCPERTTSGIRYTPMTYNDSMMDNHK